MDDDDALVFIDVDGDVEPLAIEVVAGAEVGFDAGVLGRGLGVAVPVGVGLVELEGAATSEIGIDDAENDRGAVAGGDVFDDGDGVRGGEVSLEVSSLEGLLAVRVVNVEAWRCRRHRSWRRGWRSRRRSRHRTRVC